MSSAIASLVMARISRARFGEAHPHGINARSRGPPLAAVPMDAV